jgi:hypothetical protein
MKVIFAVLILVISCIGHSGTEGGGGDVVILPDGRVVLADVFLDHNAPQPNNMPKQISLNPKLLLQVKIYTAFFRKLILDTDFLQGKSSDILDLFDVLGKRQNDLAFYTVADAAELNDFCASGGRKAYLLEDGHRVEQVACTSGAEVFLIEPLFRKMTLVQQALLLFHERLTTFRDSHGGKSYQAIAGFTSGLHKILEISYEQQQGTKRLLSEGELAKVMTFYESVFEIEYRNTEVPLNIMNWSLHSFGGGMVKSGANADETSFIGITSVVGAEAQVGKNSEIINTVVPENAVIKEEVILSEVKFLNRGPNFLIYIGERTHLEKVTFAVYGKIKIGGDLNIKGASFQGSSLEIPLVTF